MDTSNPPAIDTIAMKDIMQSNDTNISMFVHDAMMRRNSSYVVNVSKWGNHNFRCIAVITPAQAEEHSVPRAAVCEIKGGTLEHRIIKCGNRMCNGGRSPKTSHLTSVQQVCVHLQLTLTHNGVDIGNDGHVMTNEHDDTDAEQDDPHYHNIISARGTLINSNLIPATNLTLPPTPPIHSRVKCT